MVNDVIKLGDVATYINGYAFKPEDRGEVGLPIIRIQDLTGNAYDLGFYDGEYPEKIEINDGDVLISWSASLGVYVWNRGRALLNQHIFKVVFDKVDIDKNYFVYAVCQKLVEMGMKTHGATMKHIVKKDFDATLIPYPSLNEQAEIATNLNKVSRVIEARKQELQLLDDLIKARFVELFGDRYVNDKNWNTTKLGESISFNNGKAHEQVVDENGEYILVTSRAIASDFEDVRRTNTLLFPLHKNDIVMVMSDVPNGKALAKCQLIDSDDKYTLNQRICSFDNYEYNPIFLLHLLNRHPYFLSFNDGNGQTNLRKNDILECELIVPPMELQEQFADFVHQVDKSKVAVQKALDETQLLFDSLMQEYFG